MLNVFFNKPKLVLIDHSYRKKTKSINFLYNLLKEEYTIIRLWDETWKGKPIIDPRSVLALQPDVVMLFQIVHYPERWFKALGGTPIVLCPMYDACVLFPDSGWARYENTRIVCFSKTLHAMLQKKGLNAFSVQYYPPPRFKQQDAFMEEDHEDVVPFFWQRRTEIGWTQVKELLANTQYSGLHYHAAYDPNQMIVTQPSKRDLQGGKISRWYCYRRSLLKEMRRCNLYFAPRLVEGIGLSFLEAMSLGLVCVAHDRPTMNEYIDDGSDGYLFNIEDIKPIDFTNLKRVREKMIERYKRGRAEWIEGKQGVLQFISQA